MIDVQTLSIKEKIDLLNDLYVELSGHGVGGDTELAHINPWEADLLRAVGGAGTVNEVTGLRQYLGGGSAPPPPPTTTTTRQVPEYAPEQREYVTDIFGKAQELYEQRTAEGFQPFPGQQLAGFAPEEQEAFSGIAGLARGPGAAPAFDIARGAALGAASQITTPEIQGLMNPYQQAVTDIGKREAVRQYQRGPQAQLRTGAVEAGGLRGARRFIEEAEGQRNLQQHLSDLQMSGSQQAYDRAMAEAAASRGRLANLATQMPAIGTGAYQQQMTQMGQLGGVGEARRGMEQASIDLAQNQFQRELMFPEETLATYLRFITNAPSPSGFQQTTQAPGVRGPSTIAQLGGLAGGLGTLAGGLGGKGGLLGMNKGGSVRRAGLNSIVRRAGGGRLVRMAGGGSPFMEDLLSIPKRGAEVTQQNLDRAEEQRRQAQTSDPARIAEYLTGSQETLDRMNFQKEAEADLLRGVRREVASETKAPDGPAPAKKETVTVQTPPAPDGVEESEWEQYQRMLTDVDTDKDLTWPERLQLASAFFQAGGQNSTGTLLGDLSQFGATASAGAAPALQSRSNREASAMAQHKALVKDFLKMKKDSRRDALTEQKTMAEIAKLRAEAAEKGKLKLENPEDNEIARAITFLEQTGVDAPETKKIKGKFTETGTAYDLAVIAKTLGSTTEAAFQRVLQTGALREDGTIDVDAALTERSVLPTETIRRADGGRLSDPPVLRYPEDFV